MIADPREMDVAGGRLHAAGAPVDLVYRRAVLSELVQHESEVRTFLGAADVNAARARIWLGEGPAAVALARRAVEREDVPDEEETDKKKPPDEDEEDEDAARA